MLLNEGGAMPFTRVVGLGTLLLLPLIGAETPPSAAIADAAKRADIARVQSLLKQGLDVNAPQVDGTTALHWAAQLNDPMLVDVLIAAGANPKTVNRYGVSPVFVAASNAGAPVVEKLLQAGA